jgi:hypothetical protein
MENSEIILTGCPGFCGDDESYLLKLRRFNTVLREVLKVKNAEQLKMCFAEGGIFHGIYRELQNLFGWSFGNTDGKGTYFRFYEKSYRLYGKTTGTNELIKIYYGTDN